MGLEPVHCNTGAMFKPVKLSGNPQKIEISEATA